MYEKVILLIILSLDSQYNIKNIFSTKENK